MVQSACGGGGRFRRCHAPVVNSCQYCGHGFCSEHAYFVEGYDAVCTRKQCRLKHEDLKLHMDYRRRVFQRNAAGLCGVEECGPHPRTECSLCRGHFCEEHITDRLYPFREGRVVVERRASICSWCWDRRKIWHS